MRARDVFTPGGSPTVTYVEKHLIEKKQHFLDALDAGSTLISISGPSKSGKTVFVEQTLGKGNIVQITGAGINSSDELWGRVFDVIGAPRTSNTSESRTSSFSTTASGEVSGSILVAKGRGGLSGSCGSTRTTQETSEIQHDNLNLIIKEFKDSGVAIFVDDFHYIPKDVQVELARQIKELIWHNVLIICASTPYHSDDVLRGNPDLMGRVFALDFDYWTNENLSDIASLGFTELGIAYNKDAISTLADEAAGSPQLMQYLCLTSCFVLGVREKGTPATLTSDQDTLSEICKRTSMTSDFSSVVECMKDGPKTRGSERRVFITKYGWQGDVYRLLAKALSLDPPKLTVRYPELTERISRVCVNDTPSGSSVVSSCNQIASIINSKVGQAIVEWDSENDVFDIRDPYFLFFLRWADAVG